MSARDSAASGLAGESAALAQAKFGRSGRTPARTSPAWTDPSNTASQSSFSMIGSGLPLVAVTGSSRACVAVVTDYLFGNAELRADHTFPMTNIRGLRADSGG